MSTDRPDIVSDEHLQFLDELRSSGEVNMMGAAKHLMKAFILDQEEAKTVLFYWMDLKESE